LSGAPQTARQRRTARRPGRKLLGIDLGARRIGIAVSDDTGLIAAPVAVIDLQRGDLSDIALVATKYDVEAIVAGLPVNSMGDEGFQARDARAQCARLADLTQLPIVMWDERLTTAIAEDILAARGRSRRPRRDDLDAVAAAVMLQSYLDSHPLPRGDHSGG